MSFTMRPGHGRWVMIDGVGPGIGKSTLAENLTEALAAHGMAVDLVAPEDAIFNRPEFALAGGAFLAKDYAAARDGLLRAYDALVERNADAGSWVVFDWSCAGMAEDLPWAEEIAVLTDHVRQVREIAAAFDPILLMLEGTVDDALDRAIGQRGSAWLERYAARATESVDPNETLRNRAVRYLSGDRRRIERVREASEAAGWLVESIDASASAEDVLASALCALGVDPLRR